MFAALESSTIDARGSFDAGDDLVGIFAAGAHIARRYPAGRAPPFEVPADLVSLLAVLGGITDER